MTDDAALLGTTLDHTLLAYAQGWLLVYYLMKTPVRLPQFQAYLKTIYTRTDKNHRYDDAEKHFGDLDRLDQDLRREAIRLQRETATLIDLAPDTHAERPCPRQRHRSSRRFPTPNAKSWATCTISTLGWMNCGTAG